MPAFDITKSDQTIEHGLGTRDLLVQGWQNGHLVRVDVAQKDENELRVFTIGASEQNPLRLVVLSIGTGFEDPAKPSKATKEKPSASKQDKPKTTRRRTTKPKAS